jgi:hypothetical protein
LVVVSAVTALLLSAAPASAAVETRTVTNNNDPGDGSCDGTCSLRDAIIETNDGDTTDQDQIVVPFNSPFNNTIDLTSSLPTIAEPLVINVNGLFGATINGQAAHRAITINTAASADVSIFNLTITGSRGAATFGGGIKSSNADLTISGGGVFSSATLAAGADGGGIGVEGGSLTLENTTISGNGTVDANGGGVHVNAPLTIRRSTISDNQAGGASRRGGGVFATGNTFAKTIETTTISGNRTTGNGSHGGGLAIGFSPITILNSTISENFTAGTGANGGGIWAFNGAPTPLALTNTIVANNAIMGTGFGPDLHTDTGDTFALAYSLVETTPSGPFSETVPGSNLLGVDPQLGGLAFNGGVTMTHLPAATSPVIDKGSTAESTDQRGQPRPVDIPHVANSAAAGSNGADIGSVELTLAEGPPAPPETPVTPTTTQPAPTGQLAAAIKKCKKKFPKGKKRKKCIKRAKQRAQG